MLHRFFGGVHPADRKRWTAKSAIAPLSEAPAQVVLPLCPEGGERRCLAAVGDTVARGQLLAEATGEQAAVHASISGKIVAIEPRLQSWGGKSMCVVIENSAKAGDPPPSWPSAPPEHAPEELEVQAILDAARKAGVAGMGGEEFPTHLKLAKARGRVDTLILNGVESEPYVTADQSLMLEWPAAVLLGARLMMRCLGVKKAVVAVTGNKYDAINALRSRLPLRGGSVRIKVLRNRYPLGSEKQLIQKLTGRQVPAGGKSTDVHCAVFSVATAAALYDAVYGDGPLVRRVVTVSGSAVRSPKNLLVPLGTSLEELFRAAGGWKVEPDRILVGGPMTGVSQFDLSVPVTKGTSAVLALTAAESRSTAKNEGACIRCGRCVEVCPMHLDPADLHLYADAERWERLEKLHIEQCIECGACAYACPARIRLVHSIRAGKQHLNQLAEAQRGGEGDAEG